MAKKTIYGSVRRFGSRYGRKPKFKLGHIETVTRTSAKCPYCRKQGVKKLAIGIFYCSKCNTKFTGKAYAPLKSRKAEAGQPEEEEIAEFEENPKKKEHKQKPEAEPEEDESSAAGKKQEEE
jgi:large subunit ribosomal protein L37Ae